MTRIYTDGSRDSTLTTSISWLLAGVAIGAGLMYLLDPNQGNRRRALARDKAYSASLKARQAISARTRDLGNRAQGIKAKASSMLNKGNGQDQLSDGLGTQSYGSQTYSSQGIGR